MPAHVEAGQAGAAPDLASAPGPPSSTNCPNWCTLGLARGLMPPAALSPARPWLPRSYTGASVRGPCTAASATRNPLTPPPAQLHGRQRAGALPAGLVRPLSGRPAGPPAGGAGQGAARGAGGGGGDAGSSRHGTGAPVLLLATLPDSQGCLRAAMPPAMLPAMLPARPPARPQPRPVMLCLGRALSLGCGSGAPSGSPSLFLAGSLRQAQARDVRYHQRVACVPVCPECAVPHKAHMCACVSLHACRYWSKWCPFMRCRRPTGACPGAAGALRAGKRAAAGASARRGARLRAIAPTAAGWRRTAVPAWMSDCLKNLTPDLEFTYDILSHLI